MKHLAISTSLISMSFAAMLAAATPAHSWSGFYVGATIGGGVTELTLTSDDGVEFNDSEENFTAMLIGGYERPLTSRFFAAGEVYMDGNDTVFLLASEDTPVRREFRNNLRLGANGVLGAYLRSGIQNSAVYVFVGPHWQYWEDSISGTESRVPLADERVYTGFQVGLGGRHIFTNSFGVRLDYRFVQVRPSSNIAFSAGDVERQTMGHEFSIGVTYSIF